MSKSLTMYGYWRSQATYRLRVAMNLKNVSYNEIPINLDTGEQHQKDFLSKNPLGSVPALLLDNPDTNEPTEPLTQSLAILEYLEEVYPDPPILPKSPIDRARVRSLASIAVSDAHPLIVPRIRNYLRENAGFSPEQWKEWQTKWFTTALQGFEKRLVGDKRTGKFCHGDVPGMADICLAGLVQGTRAFEIWVEGIPTVQRIVGECEELEAFEKAKAMHQKDFPGKK